MVSTNEHAATLQAALADLPARLRVHELAKRAGLTSKDTIAALAERGVAVGSAASSVSAEDAAALLTALLAPAVEEIEPEAVEPPVKPKRTRARRPVAVDEPDTGLPTAEVAEVPVPLFLAPEETPAPAKRTRSRGRAALAEPPVAAPAEPEPVPVAAEGETAPKPRTRRRKPAAAAPEVAQPLATEHADQADESDQAVETAAAETTGDTEPAAKPTRSRRRRGRAADADGSGSAGSVAGVDGAAEPTDAAPAAEDQAETQTDDAESADTAGRRRRRRGRRGRGRIPGEADLTEDEQPDSDTATGQESEAGESDSEDADGGETEGEREDASESSGRRRRRRRRRGGSDETVREDDPDNTVVHVREARPAVAEVQGVRGSTRLEAKRQRRRDSRDSRRRPQILTEAEFLARREAVDRVMAVRQRGDLAQVALLEDGVLVEHFVSKAGSESMIGNIYLGRVQNVLPSMEAAFIDIGRGRNAVLYAGEVNWDAAGLAGKARRIETALTSGDTMLVQVSKDPIGHKGARLTTQISLPGRFLVYVPGGGATGISRKLPDTERKRLKAILDRIVPDDAGVIIRTAAEGAPEEELARDVERLKAQWQEISSYADKSRQSSQGGNNNPVQLSSEPDTLIKVVRDLFNSDISTLVVDGDDSFAAVSDYVNAVAPELAERVHRFEQPAGSKADVFSSYRIDEQIAKALERKVHLPSGGSLVIDRTEAMTVVDVNTGKYTGSGGNLEETVTKNNLEAAEEIVRQLRLRDIGGIIVIDFIDMVLESNRELVMRRLTECLGRDRTRHQVAEVTSLGLVQMTRKKMGTGLVEAFSEPCSHCNGRGIILRDVPVDPAAGEDDGDHRSARRRGRGRAPEPVEAPKITVPVVRPPDPRGPKPPVRTAAEIAADRTDGAVPTVEAQASDAVTAVLAALDAQQARDRAAQRIDDEPDESVAGLPAVVAVEEQAEPSVNGQAEPAVVEEIPAGRRRRGRRAAGRPAGAPSGDSGAVVVVPAGEPAPAVQIPVVGVSTVVVDVPEAAPRRRRRAASRPAGPAGA